LQLWILKKSEGQYKDNKYLVTFNDIKVSEHLAEQVKVMSGNGRNYIKTKL
jgi:LEA14-like dessication related protein